MKSILVFMQYVQCGLNLPTTGSDTEKKFAAYGSWSFKFNGTLTNCDDNEIEKYFILGQTDTLEGTKWKEYVK